jgi:hypothetical protein
MCGRDILINLLPLGPFSGALTAFRTLVTATACLAQLTEPPSRQRAHHPVFDHLGAFRVPATRPSRKRQVRPDHGFCHDAVGTVAAVLTAQLGHPRDEVVQLSSRHQRLRSSTGTHGWQRWGCAGEEQINDTITRGHPQPAVVARRTARAFPGPHTPS